MSEFGCDIACFKSMKDEKWNEQDRLNAIYRVAYMETYNSITKEDLKNALKWLFERVCEVVEETEVTE